ncbi:DUF3592 domain-containing protein [Pseudarthrobacter enclensis]|uniref:DUF3592 domain-containing protein n=1 Tax=Pseudarthrobacter enclensis TaxID=993070 RepID=A0ABT9RYX8_9MICC|nr:DUF3592 domain-containing protein [Pseudarthrobacter enclensis]MDP9889404.1 hypothetical protein [Pseudarthrobacter enclensis]
MKTILYIVWALFIAAAIFSLVYAGRRTRRQARLMAQWPKAQATVTGSTTGWTGGVGGASRNLRYYPTYQFTDPQGTLFMGKSEISGVKQPLPGSLIEVAYNPANPNESLQVSSEPRTAMGCLIAFFAVFAVASFWFIGVFPLG